MYYIILTKISSSIDKGIWYKYDLLSVPRRFFIWIRSSNLLSNIYNNWYSISSRGLLLQFYRKFYGILCEHKFYDDCFDIMDTPPKYNIEVTRGSKNNKQIHYSNNIHFQFCRWLNVNKIKIILIY
jgi:hypothetical protein